MKKHVAPVLLATFVLLMCSADMLGQAAQPASGAQAQSGTQAAPDTQTQTDAINAQEVERLRQNLREKRKELMVQNMPLTPEEAAKFWPVFEQYRKEAIKPNDERWALIKDYATNYDTMTDAQANDYMKRATAVDQQLLALRLSYVPIFEKVISPKKTALWYQIDRHIDLIINLQLSAFIPMVDASK
jgi:hypothetical protein